MPELAANLSWIYQEVPFLQRFGAAAAHGFKAVEILFPYEAPAAEIAAELKKHRLTQALFNLPPGDWSKGERGLAALPGREADFAAALEKALDYATRNYTSQKEPRDAEILMRAALAANQPKAAEPALAWLKANNYEDPALVALAAQLTGAQR